MIKSTVPRRRLTVIASLIAFALAASMGSMLPNPAAWASSATYFNGDAGWALWKIDRSRTVDGGTVWGDVGSLIQVVTVRTHSSTGQLWQSSTSASGKATMTHQRVLGTSSCRWTILGGATPAQGTSLLWYLKCAVNIP